MKIPVTCVRCGKRYAVEAASAGKKAKCTACGERVMIPDAQPAVSPDASEPDAYQLDEAPGSDQSTSFSPAPGSENFEEPRLRRRAREKASGKSGTKPAGPSGSHPALSGRMALIGLAGVLAVAVLIAVFVPAARMNVGRGIALTGLIIFLYGYGSGAYIAFTEDGLYGWLYVIFPPFAAYYFVSRWDEMSGRLAMLFVGLALLAGGGRLLDTGRAAEAADDTAIGAQP